VPPVTRVFICDDNPELRELTRIGLEEDPLLHVVGEAQDAPTAIAAIPLSAPDVLLLDLSMPGMDGLEALPHIRAAAPSMRIVVFSGFSARRLAARSLELGADEYVEKGTPIEMLRDTIRACAA
jgi:DNA-binding NarL/FixJ family response regulator